MVCTHCGARVRTGPALVGVRGLKRAAEVRATTLFSEDIPSRDRSLWRHWHTLPVSAGAESASLGEGGTPLIALDMPPGAAR